MIISISTVGKNILRLAMYSVVGLGLTIFQSSPTLAGMGGMGGKGGMGGMKEPGSMIGISPEKQAQQIADILSLSEIQQVEVVYLLERMFRRQAEYMEQAKTAEDQSRNEVLEKMQKLNRETLDLVGDFLNDTKLDQLTEMLNSDMKNPMEAGSKSGFGRGGKTF